MGNIMCKNCHAFIAYGFGELAGYCSVECLTGFENKSDVSEMRIRRIYELISNAEATIKALRTEMDNW